MKLVVGLGNYPLEYKMTRHNAGFIVVDELYDRFGNDFEQFHENKKFIANITEGELFGEKTILLKPKTFMNLSGDSVSKVMKFYKISPQDLIVIHDELDFPFGVVKPTLSHNPAGHNGIKSINSYVHDTYSRIRVGIGRPKEQGYDITNYVLSKFSKEEQEHLDDVVDKAIDILKSIFNGTI